MWIYTNIYFCQGDCTVSCQRLMLLLTPGGRNYLWRSLQRAKKELNALVILVSRELWLERNARVFDRSWRCQWSSADASRRSLLDGNELSCGIVGHQETSLSVSSGWVWTCVRQIVFVIWPHSLYVKLLSSLINEDTRYRACSWKKNPRFI
jgi:hypothetical protein